MSYIREERFILSNLGNCFFLLGRVHGLESLGSVNNKRPEIQFTGHCRRGDILAQRKPQALFYIINRIEWLIPGAIVMIQLLPGLSGDSLDSNDANILSACRLQQRQVVNEIVAVGTMQACQDSGRKVPDDIAIIGFDDAPLASIVRPSLTTVHIGVESLGKLAMETLLSMIEGKDENLAVEHTITPKLVIRDSAP